MKHYVLGASSTSSALVEMDKAVSITLGTLSKCFPKALDAVLAC